MNRIIKAAQVASLAHQGQVRKYSGVPYIVHPGRVANKYMLTDDPTEVGVCASWDHDILEDCKEKGYTFEVLERLMGTDVAKRVRELTNVSKVQFPNSNRAERKKMDHDRIATVSHEAKIIKLCDRIDNLRDIPLTEPFAPKYARESKELLLVLKGTNRQLEDEFEQVLGLFGVKV